MTKQDAFGAAGSSVKLVVLSACYSEPQAAALVAHVDCVVGLASSIDDATARAFAIGFYGGLGDGDPVGVAFWQGRAATSLIASPSKGAIMLAARNGVDVDGSRRGRDTAGGPGCRRRQRSAAAEPLRRCRVPAIAK